MPANKRTCTATTKKGTRCTRNAINGGKTCIAHLPKDEREARGFGGPQPGSGRPRNPNAIEMLRERIEENIEAVIGPLWAGLDADMGVVVGNGAHAELQLVADHRTRIAASREILDRGYGKPKQSTEISTPEGSGLLIAPVDQAEKSRKAAELLNGLGQVAA